MNSPYNIVPLQPNMHGWYKSESQRNLARLISEHNPKVVFELGSWMGVSSIDIASRLGEGSLLLCIDTWEGSVEHKTDPRFSGMLPNLYHQFLSNVMYAGQTKKIMPLRASTTEAANSTEMTDVIASVGRPKIIFIDASHQYPDVLFDMRSYWPLLDTGGIMCGDDAEWPGVKQSIMEFCAEAGTSVRYDQGYWEFGPKP